jgi:hypothetical protein
MMPTHKNKAPKMKKSTANLYKSATNNTDLLGYHFKLTMEENARARFNRDQIANSSIMYTECYEETFGEDIFDHLVSVQFNEDEMGEECELLSLVEFNDAMEAF